MFDIYQLMVLIPALPLLAALVTLCFGKWLLKERSHWPVMLALGTTFVCSCLLLTQVHEGAQKAQAEHKLGFEKTQTLWTWLDFADTLEPLDSAPTDSAKSEKQQPAVSFLVDISLRSDPLTSIMLCMVTFVSTLVVIYASGYMHGDPGYWRFFTYVALFVFSMTMLVSSSNFLMLYVFWEAVGVCSYLLIGFWFQKPEAAAAGKKAFLVNRIGDFGFALGVFLIWTTYGTLSFQDSGSGPGAIAGVLGEARLSGSLPYVGGWIGLAIPLLLFVGACGKSAQFPLHVWLPDAMEGPTPVSALIHAATMVTAGVYMVTRCMPLFLVDSTSLIVVACIGGFTALLAGVIAVTQYDLKRVLAYSTVSQLGYMFLGLGVGSLAGITAGMFHLFTHAFFKALLFLGAGSVMHAMHHVIDMRRFSGLRRIMPWTHITFWFGSLALAGVVPFAGFWSKDAIFGALHERLEDGPIFVVLYGAGLFTAFLTAFYTFRALFMTFFGETRVPPEAGHHAHESPPAMTIPLVILAVCALVVGAYFEYTHGFANFLAHTPQLNVEALTAHAHHEHKLNMTVAVTSSIVALAGVALAAYFYLGDRKDINRITHFMQSNYGLRLYQLSYGKFFFDQIYNLFLVWPLRLFAAISYWFDRRVIDALVDGVGQLPVRLGAMFRTLQTGLVQFYALAMVLGLLVLIGTLLAWPMK